MGIKRIIREYYEQLYAHKFDNLHEMNKFFEKHELPKLTNDNLNKPLSIKEIKPILNVFQNKEHSLQTQVVLLLNSTKH